MNRSVLNRADVGNRPSCKRDERQENNSWLTAIHCEASGYVQ